MRWWVHPVFFVVVLLAIFYAATGLLLALLFAVILHELGHLGVARMCGVVATGITLTPCGGAVTLQARFLTRWQQTLIYLAGPLTNFLLTLLFGTLIWLWPIAFSVFEYLVVANCLVGVLNILPLYPLDGGKLWALIVPAKIVRWWSNIVLFLALLLACIHWNLGWMLATSVLLLQVNWEYRQTCYHDKFSYRGGAKSGKFVRCAVLCQNSLLTAYKMVDTKRPTEFIVTDCADAIFYERDLETWLLKYPANTPIGNCLK